MVQIRLSDVEVSSSSDTRDVVDNLECWAVITRLIPHTTTPRTFCLVGYVRTRLLQPGQPGTPKLYSYSGQ